jgi:thiamine-monophosphate kinase
LWVRVKLAIIVPMNVGELGEFGLIDLIAGLVGEPSRSDTVLGIGDDASVWRPSGLQIGTTDALIQDVHFTLDTATWRDLGWKALAINISDIAAMGGVPCRALVSLGLPPATDVEDVLNLYRGMLELASDFSVDICGGNVSSAPVVVVNLAVMGETSGPTLTREAARPGDSVAVTGYLGHAAAGLAMLSASLRFDSDTMELLRRAHLRPRPRVEEAKVLVRSGVRAAIDLSDGLLGDLGHICRASQVGARIRVHDLPVHPLVKTAFGERSVDMAVSGGEDYELLFAAEDDVIERVRSALPGPVTLVGEIVADDPGKVTLLGERGEVLEHAGRSWDHFGPVA